MFDQDSLEVYRSQLDQLDEQIMNLLAQRLNVCRRVAQYKKARRIPMMQSARVQFVIQQAADRARSAGISEEFATALYSAIIAEACRLEDDIIESHQSVTSHARCHDA